MLKFHIKRGVKKMKYIKEYNNEYYQEITLQEYGYMLYPDTPPNSVDFTKDEVNILKELDKKHDYDFTIHSDTVYFQFIKENWWIYFTICKKKDEWYIIESQELQAEYEPGGLRGIDKEISKRYKCDQFEGLCEFLKDMLMKYSKKYNSKIINNKIVENLNNTYYKLTYTEHHDISNRMKVSDLTQNEINKIINSQIKHTNRLSISHPEKSLVNINNKIKITIQKREDEWFTIADYTGSLELYKCDQIDGVIDCMDYLYKKHDEKINESNYFYKDKPPSLIGKRPIKINYRDIPYLNNALGNYMKANNKNMEITPILRQEEYIRICVEPTALPITLRSRLELVKYEFNIYNMGDEWYSVLTGGPDYMDTYWCDQIDGVAKYIKHKIEELYPID